MSPEQARGDAVDARSDVFAAGILLWELLAGRRMYSAGPGAALSKEAARGDLLELARRASIPPLVERGLPTRRRSTRSWRGRSRPRPTSATRARRRCSRTSSPTRRRPS